MYSLKTLGGTNVCHMKVVSSQVRVLRQISTSFLTSSLKIDTIIDSWYYQCTVQVTENFGLGTLKEKSLLQAELLSTDAHQFKYWMT